MKKTFLSETTKPRAVVFDMQYKKVVYSNYIHGAKNTPPLGSHALFYVGLLTEM